MLGRGHRLRHLRGGGQAAQQRVEDAVEGRRGSTGWRFLQRKGTPPFFTLALRRIDSMALALLRKTSKLQDASDTSTPFSE